MPAPLTTVSAGAINNRAASSRPTASSETTVATIARAAAWLPGRSPTWIARQPANEASSRMRGGAAGPRSSSIRGSWTTASPMATIEPASNEMITASSVSVAPLPTTAPSNPSAPSANAPSLTTSSQNSRRAIRIRRIVSSIAHATDAAPNRMAEAASTSSTASAIAQVTTKIAPADTACDRNSARRRPGSNRSRTVSESPIQPVCTELAVISTPNSRLNVPRPVAPSSLSTTSAISRLVPATIICDTIAPSGRRRTVSSRGGRGNDGRRPRR